MADDDGEATRPILTRRVLRRDGTRTLGLRVFCARDGASVSVDACRRCEAFLEDVEDSPAREGSWIRCRPGPPSRHAIGELLQAGPACIGEDVPAPMIADCFVESRDVLVVDSLTHLIGVVREIHLVRPAPHVPTLYPTAADLMVSPVAVLESASVGEALHRMAHSHLRSIPVVTLEGEPVGVLSDIVALRALTRERGPRH